MKGHALKTFLIGMAIASIIALVAFLNRVDGLLDFEEWWATTAGTNATVATSAPAHPANIVRPFYQLSPPRQTPELDCSMVNDIVVVGELGRGNHRITFEVVLPSGKRAAAKRCITSSCESHHSLAQEAWLFHELEAQFGESALAFYGICQFDWWPFVEEHRVNSSFDGSMAVVKRVTFTRGSTLFMELGEPIRENHTLDAHDRESLRELARQYSVFRGGTIRLAGDNGIRKQYVRRRRSRDRPGRGIIRHIDFGTAQIEAHTNNNNNGDVESNCNVLLNGIARLKRGDPRINCTAAYSASGADNISFVPTPVISNDTGSDLLLLLR